MVKKILSFLHRQISGLHEAAYLLATFSLLSHLLALVRDKLLAFTFGADRSLDIYYAAFRLPDFVFVTVGSVVSLSVLVPFLSKLGGNKEEQAQFLNSTFTSFLITISFAALICFVFAPFIMHKIFRGFSSSDMDSLIYLTRIILLSPIILGASNILGAIAQIRNRFLVYALSPIAYNVGIILGVFFLVPRFGLPGLAYGVVIGALMHVLVLIPGVLSLGSLPRLTLDLRISQFRALLALSIPRTLALSASHIAVFALLSFASLMPEGSIAIFNLSFNLQSVPLSIIGVSYSLAAFPSLSRLFSEGKGDDFVNKIVSSARHIIFWSIPATVLFIVLRAHIVRVVLGAGSFDWTDTRLAAAVLALFVISLVAQSLVLLFLRGLYASGSTGKPFYASAVSAVSIVIFSYAAIVAFNGSVLFKSFLEALFKVSDLEGTIVLTLALGFTLGSILDLILMWYIFSKRFKNFSWPVLHNFLTVFASSVIMGFACFLSLRVFDNLFPLEFFLGGSNASSTFWRGSFSCMGSSFKASEK